MCVGVVLLLLLFSWGVLCCLFDRVLALCLVLRFGVVLLLVLSCLCFVLGVGLFLFC